MSRVHRGRGGRSLLVLAGLILGAPPLRGQDSTAGAAPADTTPLYSSAQARRGQAVYGRHCVSCHSSEAYTGVAFRRAWGNRPAYELWEQIRTTMPQNAPGTLSAREYADIVAYLLRLNGLPAGPRELPADADALMALVIRVPPSGS